MFICDLQQFVSYFTRLKLLTAWSRDWGNPWFSSVPFFSSYDLATVLFFQNTLLFSQHLISPFYILRLDIRNILIFSSHNLVSFYTWTYNPSRDLDSNFYLTICQLLYRQHFLQIIVFLILSLAHSWNYTGHRLPPSHSAYLFLFKTQ